MKLQLDSVIAGIVIGICVPVVGYGIISYIFDLLTSANLMDYVSSSTGSSRTKTVWLFAICCNLIPFNIFKRNKHDNTMRGIVFPTICMVVYWIYTYQTLLFG